jgi:hypothetical protein
MSNDKGGGDAPERAFDFWLGSWRLSWPAEQTGGQAGAQGLGSNRITSLWDGRVVQENFSTDDGAFQGKSWSLYHAPSGEWRQTWVDNGGGYLLFRGGPTDAGFELRTDTVERNGKELVNRMVFREITEASLGWYWQRSEDGGGSWHDVWTIRYRRE